MIPTSPRARLLLLLPVFADLTGCGECGTVEVTGASGMSVYIGDLDREEPLEQTFFNRCPVDLGTAFPLNSEWAMYWAPEEYDWGSPSYYEFFVGADHHQRQIDWALALWIDTSFLIQPSALVPGARLTLGDGIDLANAAWDGSAAIDDGYFVDGDYVDQMAMYWSVEEAEFEVLGFHRYPESCGVKARYRMRSAPQGTRRLSAGPVISTDVVDSSIAVEGRDVFVIDDLGLCDRAEEAPPAPEETVPPEYSDTPDPTPPSQEPSDSGLDPSIFPFVARTNYHSTHLAGWFLWHARALADRDGGACPAVTVEGPNVTIVGNCVDGLDTSGFSYGGTITGVRDQSGEAWEFSEFRIGYANGDALTFSGTATLSPDGVATWDGVATTGGPTWSEIDRYKPHEYHAYSISDFAAWASGIVAREPAAWSVSGEITRPGQGTWTVRGDVRRGVCDRDFDAGAIEWIGATPFRFEHDGLTSCDGCVPYTSGDSSGQVCQSPFL
jgi:hypothetical protein